MNRLEFSTLAGALAVRVILDKLLGYPRPGVFLGGGPTPQTVQGSDRYQSIKQVVSRTGATVKSRSSTWVIVIDGVIANASQDSTFLANLTAAQKTALAAAIANIKTVADSAADMDDVE